MSILRKLLRLKPCKKCPYKLGYVVFVKNPCPECMLNGYKTYKTIVESFNKQNHK